MPFERSAGAVVFRTVGKSREYLLLQAKFKSSFWDVPKGNIEEGETPEQTVIREVKEETGLDVNLLPGFQNEATWFYTRDGKQIRKQAMFFLAEAKEVKVTLSDEHIAYAWLPLKEAVARATFKNTKGLLREADEKC
jgi:8-oxo-dGTP pyrophosphatase MutT (NUDIX family)